MIRSIMTGLFIALEGIDGAGTTTQAALLCDWLAEQGHAVHRTFEPSPGRIGQLIRDYLAGTIDVPDPDLHFHALALLFAADRLDHLAREINPRVKKGDIVVSDRYLLSSLVYQNLHCDPAWVHRVNFMAPPPDLTLLLDLPVDHAMERIARRSLFSGVEIFENEDLQTKLRDLYLQAAKHHAADHHIVVIDGAPEPNQVFQHLKSAVQQTLNSK